MSDSLTHQSELAPRFIKQSWESALTSATSTIEQLGGCFTEIYFAGCGDSFYAGLGLEYCFNTWADIRTIAGSSLKVGRYLVPRLMDRDHQALVIAISASGEVARTLEVLDLAKHTGAKTIGITANPESSLAKSADAFLTLQLPDLPHGPGLISYLASLLSGYALCGLLGTKAVGEMIRTTMQAVPEQLDQWISGEGPRGKELARRTASRSEMVLVGAGPDHASAMFSAAKVVEACGVSAWGQDTEEWAHIEYFSEPANMLTWILSSAGRAVERETEIEAAAKAIGRNLVVSRWKGWSGLERSIREAISPLFLWAGPVAFAAELAEILGEQPFRGFGGGRSKLEGGGISRIRSSERVHSIEELI